MSKRIVTRTLKNEDGDMFLYNPNEAYQSLSVDEVIGHIERGLHSYVLAVTGFPETDIHVVNGIHGKYLRTVHDSAKCNNLGLLDTVSITPPLYLGDYPDNKKSNWSDNLRGVTHSSDHWFFTQKTKLIKFHVSTELDTDSGSAVKVVEMPEELRRRECDHFGDPDYIVMDEQGYIFVPVEGEEGGECKTDPVVAVFREDDSLTYIGFAALTKQNSRLGTPRAGWCAISPIDLLLHSSHNWIEGENPIFR